MGTVFIALGCLLLLAIWILPVVFGVRAARSKGISPHWMWFGLHPFGAWIAFLVIRLGVQPRKRCPQCAERLLPRAKVCAYCGHAFETPEDGRTDAGGEPKRRMGLRVTAMVFGFLLFAGGFGLSLFLIISGAFDHSEVVQQALTRAQGEAALQARLGAPIETHGMLSGSIDESGPSGTADLDIPLRGPKGKGDLFVVAGKSAGVWTFTTFAFQAEGAPERLDLLHPGPLPAEPGSVSQ